MVDDFPPLPDFLNRKLNGVVAEPVPPPKRTRRRKPKCANTVMVYLIGRKNFRDGYHHATPVEIGRKHVRATIQGRPIRFTREEWEKFAPPKIDLPL